MYYICNIFTLIKRFIYSHTVLMIQFKRNDDFGMYTYNYIYLNKQ